jgi:polysaccharide export outer membrane protein
MNNTSLRKMLIIFAATAMLAACVPNRKIARLQYKNEYSEPETIGKDSLVRKYNTGEFSYLLRPNDLLDIKIATTTPSPFNPLNDADRTLVPGQVYGQSGNLAQTQGYYIDPAGFLELPLIGKLNLAGLTINQAEDTLAARAGNYLDKPVVRIKLLNFRFSVIGEVEKEATLVSGDTYLTFLQALSMAGGPSEFGDLSRIKVIRHFGGETYIFYVNLLTEEFLSSPFYFVQPDDVIVVTPLKQRSYLKYMSPNLSILTASVSLLVAMLTLFRIR